MLIILWILTRRTIHFYATWSKEATAAKARHWNSVQFFRCQLWNVSLSITFHFNGIFPRIWCVLLLSAVSNVCLQFSFGVLKTLIECYDPFLRQHIAFLVQIYKVIPLCLLKLIDNVYIFIAFPTIMFRQIASIRSAKEINYKIFCSSKLFQFRRDKCLLSVKRC